MKKLVVGLVIGLVVGGGSIAIAQTTTTSADFCVKDNGKLRLAMDGTCEAGEQLLTIEGAQGPPGPAGQDGVDGQDGAQGPAGPPGAAGADGQDGAQGPPGPAGQDGMDGVSGYEIVVDVRQWGGGGLTREAFVYCPPGKKVLGSGWGLLGAYTEDSGDIDVRSAYVNGPVASGDGWHFDIAGDFSGPIREYRLAIMCAYV